MDLLFQNKHGYKLIFISNMETIDEYNSHKQKTIGVHSNIQEWKESGDKNIWWVL